MSAITKVTLIKQAETEIENLHYSTRHKYLLKIKTHVNKN